MTYAKFQARTSKFACILYRIARSYRFLLFTLLSDLLCSLLQESEAGKLAFTLMQQHMSMQTTKIYLVGARYVVQKILTPCHSYRSSANPAYSAATTSTASFGMFSFGLYPRKSRRALNYSYVLHADRRWNSCNDLHRNMLDHTINHSFWGVTLPADSFEL